MGSTSVGGAIVQGLGQSATQPTIAPPAPLGAGFKDWVLRHLGGATLEELIAGRRKMDAAGQSGFVVRRGAYEIWLLPEFGRNGASLTAALYHLDGQQRRKGDAIEVHSAKVWESDPLAIAPGQPTPTPEQRLGEMHLAVLDRCAKWASVLH